MNWANIANIVCFLQSTSICWLDDLECADIDGNIPLCHGYQYVDIGAKYDTAKLPFVTFYNVNDDVITVTLDGRLPVGTIDAEVLDEYVDPEDTEERLCELSMNAITEKADTRKGQKEIRDYVLKNYLMIQL